MTSPKHRNMISLVFTRSCFSKLLLIKTILKDENNMKLNFCVEIKNSLKQVKRKRGHLVQIHVCRKFDFKSLSIL